jgi:hypothetical protein
MSDEQIASKDAHHVFPQKFEQEFWDRWGIDVNDPHYGSWVNSYKLGPLGETHQDWTYWYNREWADFLSTEHTKDEVLEFGKILMRGIGDVSY